MREYCDGEEIKVRAEYTLEGLDESGEPCSLHIVNQKKDLEWTPVIMTDSKALQWLNHARLHAVLEYGEGGPTVRIFAKRM